MRSDPVPLYCLFNMGNHTRNTRYARHLKILMLELFLCLNKVITEALRIFFHIIWKPLILSRHSQKRSSFYSNNDKTWARILKENDFKESEKADAQNLIQSDLKLSRTSSSGNRHAKKKRSQNMI